LVAQVPNEQLIRVRPGSSIFVDLRNAKVFPPAGAGAVSDELAGI
jgi:hypothetical protein